MHGSIGSGVGATDVVGAGVVVGAKVPTTKDPAAAAADEHENSAEPLRPPTDQRTSLE
jgi:hypothetical protein